MTPSGSIVKLVATYAVRRATECRGRLSPRRPTPVVLYAMNLIHSLHNAARRYCIDRRARWTNAYATLNASGRASVRRPDGRLEYTDEEYDIFPRYNVLSAIRSEGERFPGPRPERPAP